MRVRPESIRAELTGGRRNGPLAIAHRGASSHASCLERLRQTAPSARLMLRHQDVANLPEALERLSPFIVEFEWPNVDPEDLDVCGKSGVKSMALYLGHDPCIFRTLIRQGFDLINLDRSDIFKMVYQSDISEVIGRD